MSDIPKLDFFQCKRREPRWISAKKSLPYHHCGVLVIGENYPPAEALYDETKGFLLLVYGLGLRPINWVSHWFPMPLDPRDFSEKK